jgi:hypothetical protein
MEPFRPIVDDYVITYKDKIEDKENLLKFFNTKVNIDGNDQFIENACKIFMLKVLEFLENNDTDTLLNYKSYEFNRN